MLDLTTATNLMFNEVGFLDGSLYRKQVGGKIGIIQDPFGINGAPRYLGASTPIVGGTLVHLSLSPDGKSLTADAIFDEAIPGGSIIRKGLLRWDNLPAVILYAIDNANAGKINKPFDLDLTDIHPQKIVETALPASTGGGTTPIGWVNGIASRDNMTVTIDMPSRYGDIFKVDLLKIISDQLGGPLAGITANEVAGYFDIYGSGMGRIVTTGEDILSHQLTTGNDDKVKIPGGSGEYTYVTRKVDETQVTDVTKTGILYIAPTLDMEALRSGQRLADGTVSVSFTVMARGEEYNYTLKLRTSDFSSAAGRVFFGDRDLKDPGYSKFELNAGVSYNCSINYAIDVWRVEQRLKYLGFPAMGTNSPSISNNTIQEFKVDGEFKTEEEAALKLFEKVVRYGPGHRNFANENGTPDNSNGADGIIEASGAEKDKTESWLNAYNAPHWMQLFESTPGGAYPYATSNPGLPGWENMQKGQFPNTAAPTNIELYGTSWMYDLMAARQYAPDSLKQTQSWFNGSVDANYGFTPKWNGPQYVNGTQVTGQHKTHDLGMAFDLGVSNHIDRDGAQTRTNEQLLASIINALQNQNNGWSLTNAVAYTNHILDAAAGTVGLPDIVATPTTQGNDQVSAIRDFLSLYALTKADGQAGLDGQVVNTTAADLFGGMITKVHIGSADQNGNPIAGQNPYRNINAILGKLGITSSPVEGHQNHFHIYLKPPTPKGIATTANLLAVESPEAATTGSVVLADVQDLLDFTQTIVEGEELMFIMDVPYVPAQQPTVVLAQATTPAASPQPDYIMNYCKETESTGDPRSAMHAVDPASMLRNYIENRGTQLIELSEIKNVTLLQDATVGKITSVVDNTGRSWYRYDPIPDYIGNDRAVFLAEFEGKVYKIVVELHVFRGGVPGDFGASTCPPPKLIKVTKPSTGSSGYDLNSVAVTFADLEGGAVGLTNTSGITLDTNAANYNWFIDPTPWDNSEYLPTSNPYEWVAKAGTAAYGKMDMLSVLLHEYGHALGIEHSADNHDYMATTLTPGVRRMPSADELALMGQLVAQAKGGFVGAGHARESLSDRGHGPLLQGSTGLPGDAPMPLPIPLGGGFGLAFIGRMRKGSYGGTSIDFAGTPPITQYAVAANATFVGLNDVGRVPPADATQQTAGGTRPTLDGWLTQGSVNFENGTSTGLSTGSATLNEVSTSQTRLSQVFMLNDKDRYLSFTLSGAVLDNPSPTLPRKRDNQRLGCGRLQPSRMASYFTQKEQMRKAMFNPRERGIGAAFGCGSGPLRVIACNIAIVLSNENTIQ